MKHLLLGAALAAFFVSGASAQSMCGPTLNVLAALQAKYGEHMAARGITGSGLMFAFFANPETGTWTILEVRPDGTSCVRVAGEDFEAHALPAVGEPM